MTALVRLGVPIAFVLFALLFAYNVRDMDFRGTAFPHFAIAFILALGVIVTIKEVHTLLRERTSPEASGVTSWREFAATYARPLATIALLAIYVATIGRFGFVPVTAAFLIAICVVVGVPWRKLPLAIALMLVVTAVAHVFFSIVLQIQLP